MYTNFFSCFRPNWIVCFVIHTCKRREQKLLHILMLVYRIYNGKIKLALIWDLSTRSIMWKKCTKKHSSVTRNEVIFCGFWQCKLKLQRFNIKNLVYSQAVQGKINHILLISCKPTRGHFLKSIQKEVRRRS